MTHDPLQTYAMFGAYPGVPTFQPFTQQNYGQLPIGINPLAIQQLQQLSSLLAAQTNPQWQGAGSFQGQQNPFGGQQQNPFGGQQQNPFAALQQNPFAALQQNPYGGQQQNPFGGQQNPFGGLQQNPFAALQQNPLLAATLQNPMLHPLVAQTLGQHLQPGFGGGTPYGQTGYPLAPQSWIGQGGIGQILPLYQQLLAQRGVTGINPWGY